MNSQRHYNKYICLILCVTLFLSGCATNQSQYYASDSGATLTCESSGHTFGQVSHCTDTQEAFDYQDSDQVENVRVDWDNVGKAAAVVGFCLVVVALVAIDVAIVAGSRGRSRMVCTRTCWHWCH